MSTSCGSRATHGDLYLLPAEALDKNKLYGPEAWRLEASWRQAPLDGLHIYIHKEEVFWVKSECKDIYELEESRQCALFEQTIRDHIQEGGLIPVPIGPKGEYITYATRPWYDRSHAWFGEQGRLFEALAPCTLRDPGDPMQLAWAHVEETGALQFSAEVSCEDGLEVVTWTLHPIECARTILPEERFEPAECAEWRRL